MNEETLKKIFLQYLRREPEENEYVYHLNRNIRVEDFIEEIKNCSERTLLLDKHKHEDGRPFSIAILLSGHVRNLNIVNGILRKIVEAHDVDIFAFAWDQIGMKGTEKDVSKNTQRKLIELKLQEIPNLTAYKIDNNADFIENNYSEKITYFNHSSPEVFIKSQLYAIQQSYKLMEEHAKKENKQYDLVIKARMDLKFSSFIVDLELLEDIKKKIIFVPNSDVSHTHPDHGTSCWACDKMYYKHKFRYPHVFDHTNVVCDLFAYGSMSSMKKYCSMFEHYDRINQEYSEKNLKILKENDDLKTVFRNNVYMVTDHVQALYYVNCSFPERILTTLLEDYMLPESRKIQMYME